jgi:hypothetical protein
MGILSFLPLVGGIFAFFPVFYTNSSTVNWIIAKKRRLKKEEADAEASLLEAYQLVIERLACLSHLYYQQETIISKG